MLALVPPRLPDPWWLLALAGLGCGSSASPDFPDATPGYPGHTSRLTLRLDRFREKQCHATLVAPGWAVTAAHCFSSLSPGRPGRLEEFDRGFDTSDVFFHPLAHQSGSTSLDAVWQNAEFAAAHDLALIRFRPLELAWAQAGWGSSAACAMLDLSALPAQLGRTSTAGEPETAAAVVLGTTRADALLGPGHDGELLAVRSDGAGPGDSGSGVTVRAADLGQRVDDCELEASPNDAVLIGVLQDANPLDPVAPLGVTPLYVPEHSAWLRQTIADPANALPSDEPPVLDPL